MPFTKISLNNFAKGVVTAFGRLAQPKGSMARISNLGYFRNETGIGSLVTWGGSALSCNLASGANQGPFYYIVTFTPEGVGTTRIAIQVTGSGGTGTNLATVDPPLWGPGVTNVNSQTSFKTPQAFMFKNKLVILSGLSNPPALWDGTSVTNVTNSWTAAGYVPAWTASTAFAVGNFVQPTTPNGHFYQCIQGGTTAATEPATWPTATGGTVTDGPIIWKEAGSTTADVPNAAHGVSHQGSLWLWGTGANSDDDATLGPDSLVSSDVGDPNSYNPANRTFVGSGDGQNAQGCAVMAVEEAGVAPETRLILFKDFSTYEFLGNFPNFSLVQAKTDLGCVTPRSIQYVPQLGGLIRFTDRGFALYLGPGSQADSIISSDIDAYIFGRNDVSGVDKTNWGLGQSGLTKDFYMCAMPVQGGTNGRLQRIFIFDLNLKVWNICDLPADILLTSFNTIRQFAGDTLILVSQVADPGPTVLTMGNSFTDATNEWISLNGTEEILWSTTSPILVDPAKPQRVFYTRNVLIGGTCPASGSGGSSHGIGRILGASIIFNNPASGSDNAKNPAGTPQSSGSGTPQTKVIPIPTGGLVLPARINIGIKTRGFQLVLNGAGIINLESVDAEIVPREERPYSQS